EIAALVLVGASLAALVDQHELAVAQQPAEQLHERARRPGARVARPALDREDGPPGGRVAIVPPADREPDLGRAEGLVLALERNLDRPAAEVGHLGQSATRAKLVGAHRAALLRRSLVAARGRSHR